MPHIIQELTFAMVESQIYQVVNSINQSYMNPIHPPRLLCKFKITCSTKPNYKTHDQLIYTQLTSL